MADTRRIFPGLDSAQHDAFRAQMEAIDNARRLQLAQLELTEASLATQRAAQRTQEAQADAARAELIAWNRIAIATDAIVALARGNIARQKEEGT